MADECLGPVSQDAYLTYSIYNDFSQVGSSVLMIAKQVMRYISQNRHSRPLVKTFTPRTPDLDQVKLNMCNPY